VHALNQQIRERDNKILMAETRERAMAEKMREMRKGARRMEAVLEARMAVMEKMDAKLKAMAREKRRLGAKVVDLSFKNHKLRKERELDMTMDEVEHRQGRMRQGGESQGEERPAKRQRMTL
jgi:hypothetical protein